jgi:ribonuclease Z
MSKTINGFNSHCNNYIRFIGTAATQPFKQRNASAIYFKYKNIKILLDCGQNVTRGLLKFNESLEVDLILLTHLHGDHYYGVFGLIDTLNKNNRTKPLHIYGPQNIKILQNIYNMLNKDLKYTLEIHAISTEYSIEFQGLTISAYKMKHGVINYGYMLSYISPAKIDPEAIAKLKTKAGSWCKDILKKEHFQLEGIVYKSKNFLLRPEKTISVFYSGDTVPVNHNLKVTYLIHECTYYNEPILSKKNKHTNYTDLGMLKKYYQHEKIYLTHISEKFHNELRFINKEENVFTVYDGCLIKLED